MNEQEPSQALPIQAPTPAMTPRQGVSPALPLPKVSIPWNEDAAHRIDLYVKAKEAGLIWIPGSPIPQRSACIKNIGPGLIRIQNGIKKAAKDTKNDHFKSKYADLASMFDASVDSLIESELKLNETMVPMAGGWYLHDEIVHTDTGEFVASLAPILFTQKDNPQAFGSGLTYARRYNMQVILRIVADDDDGNAAAGRTNSNNDRDEPRTFRDPPRQNGNNDRYNGGDRQPNGHATTAPPASPLPPHIEDNIPRANGAPRGPVAITLSKTLAQTPIDSIVVATVPGLVKVIRDTAAMVFTSTADASPEDILMSYAEFLAVAGEYIAKIKAVAEKSWGHLRMNLIYQRARFSLHHKMVGSDRLLPIVQQYESAQRAKAAAAQANQGQPPA